MNKELVEKVIVGLEEAVESLYQENSTEGMMGMANQIPNISSIAADISDNEKQGEFLSILSNVLSAMEVGDCTLLADLINYELIEFMRLL